MTTIALLAAATGLNFTAAADEAGGPRDLNDALVSYTWLWTQSSPRDEEPATRKVHFTVAGDLKTSSGETWDWRLAGPRAIQIRFAPGETASTIVVSANESFDRLEYRSPQATIIGVRLVNGLPLYASSTVAEAGVRTVAPATVVMPIAMNLAYTPSQNVAMQAPVQPAAGQNANLAVTPAAQNPVQMGGSLAISRLDIANGGLNRGAYGYHRIWTWGRPPHYYWPYAWNYRAYYNAALYRQQHAYPAAANQIRVNTPATFVASAPAAVVRPAGCHRQGHMVHGAAAGRRFGHRW